MALLRAPAPARPLLQTMVSALTAPAPARGWPGALALAALLLAALPAVVAYQQAPRGFAFIGTAWFPGDFGQYAAAMREGAAGGSWLVHDHYSAEPHRPVFMYPLYVALGKLAALLGANPRLLFHVAEALGRALLLLAIWQLGRALLPTPRQQRLAFILALFSAGLSVVAAALLALGGAAPGEPATDIYPEFSTFLVLFSAPHLSLGMACLLLAARWYLASWSARGWTAPLAVTLATIGIGLTNPFSLVTIGTALAAHLGVLWLRGRPVPRAALLSGAGSLAAALPFLLYSAAVYQTDPFWSEVYGRQNIMPSLKPAELALALGPLLALAALGLPALRRLPEPQRWLIGVWIGVTLVEMYLPVSYQRRFAFGLHPFLALAAAPGLERAWGWIRRQRRLPLALDRLLLSVTTPQLLFAPTAALYASLLLSATAPQDPLAPHSLFRPQALVQAGAWLAEVSGPEDVVLGTMETGNYLGGVIPGRVFVGHRPATLGYAEKEQAAREFFSAEGSLAERLRLLAASNARYVVYGPYERALGGDAPPAALPLRLAYATPEVTIYEVTDEAVARLRS